MINVLIYSDWRTNSCTDVWQMSGDDPQRVMWPSQALTGGGVYLHNISWWDVWTFCLNPGCVCCEELMWGSGGGEAFTDSLSKLNITEQTSSCSDRLSWFVLCVCVSPPPAVSLSSFSSGGFVFFLFWHFSAVLCFFGGFFRFPSGFLCDSSTFLLFSCFFLAFLFYCFFI